jgi:hypothetical protein
MVSTNRKTNQMKKIILTLTALASLSMSAHADPPWLSAHHPWSIYDLTLFGLHAGGREATNPELWNPLERAYPGGGGNFASDTFNALNMSLEYGISYRSTESIYIRKLAYVEAAFIRLGGRPACRYDTRGNYLGNDPATTFEPIPDDSFDAIPVSTPQKTRDKRYEDMGMIPDDPK